ncbi:MAG: efflux RND transporter periplasmic adaptor subunit [Bacillota bacterium]|nr:efflux RND transporter periplasmic adaptor subunit [Bacillota bacterium]
MRSRRVRWLLAGVILAGLLVAASFVRLQQRKAVESREAAKLEASAGERVSVEVARVQVGEVVATVEVAGTLKPENDVGVVSKVPGRVQFVRVDVGQRVKAGEVLIELDRAELLAQVRQAEAAVLAARAGARQTVTAAETQVQVATGQYESAQAVLRQAEAGLKSALDNLQRLQDLYAKHAATRQQLELAQTQADVARAQAESARAAVESARSGLEGAKRHLATVKEVGRVGHDLTPTAAEAAVVQAEAALELARVQLANAVITAPVDGIVSFRNVDPGELASPGVPLVGIVSTDQVYAEVTVTEALVGKVREGMPVQVKLDAFPGRIFTGRLANLAPAADPRSRAFSARVYLPNPKGELRPGMFATAALATERRTGVVAIPTSAVVDRNGQPAVYVVEDGRAVERPVTVGLSNRQVSEILEGLTPGETLVVRGQLQLADGVAVSVTDRRVMK